MRTLRPVRAVAIGAALLLAACSGDDGARSTVPEAPEVTEARPRQASAANPTIVISDFTFSTVRAAVGTQVARNEDGTVHTVTADDGSFDVQVGPQATAAFVVNAAGTYGFSCKIHPGMTGTLEVG